MSIPKRPFYYTPDEFFDFGDLLGEHPVTFMAWLEDEGPARQMSVKIIKAYITVTFKCEGSREWDITPAIRLYPERERKYEDEIREAFESIRDADEESA